MRLVGACRKSKPGSSQTTERAMERFFALEDVNKHRAALRRMVMLLARQAAKERCSLPLIESSFPSAPPSPDLLHAE